MADPAGDDPARLNAALYALPMPATRPILTLAHSADPDDVFMWWPITGKMNPDATPRPRADGEPRIDTGRFRFRAVPGDISEFNRLAAGPAPYDLTALSVRAWGEVADRYALTRCGSSFGEGYGPKVVCRAAADAIGCFNCLKPAAVRIAVPGKRTSAFLALGLLLGGDAMKHEARFVEMPFDRIIPTVVGGEADAGLVIHEGQIAFAEAGLREVVDLGRWWGETRKAPLPLGVNAVKRDLDARFGAGSLAEVSGVLSASLAHALAHRDESIEATMPFAEANAARSGTPRPARADVARYIDMYVTDLTRDMGERGREAIRRFLADGAAAGLCPSVARVEVV